MIIIYCSPVFRIYNPRLDHRRLRGLNRCYAALRLFRVLIQVLQPIQSNANLKGGEKGCGGSPFPWPRSFNSSTPQSLPGRMPVMFLLNERDGAITWNRAMCPHCCINGLHIIAFLAPRKFRGKSSFLQFGWLSESGYRETMSIYHRLSNDG